MAQRIEDLPWVKDGIDGGEYDAVRGLIRLADAGYLARLLEEPWVVEGRNFPALESLWYLLLSSPKKLSWIMSHPTISDGISEKEANIIVTLYEVYDRDFAERLLDPEQVTVEQRTITLPLAGDTDLAIIRLSPGKDQTMDLLEHSVRTIEEFMGYPFPRRQVIYLLARAPGEYGGEHFGTHVAIALNEQALSSEWILKLIAHEAGHYYWRGSQPRWMLEGGAHLMTAVADNSLKEALISKPCALARSIVELDTLDSETNPREHEKCHYSLGERLFRDIYRNVEEANFRQAFRRLYLRTLFEPAKECEGNLNWWMCHIREAFIAYGPKETTSVIEKVIPRWHDGSEPFDRSHLSDPVVEADISAMDGRIEGAYLSFSGGRSPVSAFPLESNRTSIVLINFEYSYRPPHIYSICQSRS